MSASVFLIIISILTACIPVGMTYGVEKQFGRLTKQTLTFIILWFVSMYLIGEYKLIHDYSTFPAKAMSLMPVMFITLFFLLKTEHSNQLVEKYSVRLLIGIQAFRILPEIFLDLAYREGIVPIQMTYHGRNFDIVVAIVAIIIFFSKKYIPINDKKLGILFSIFGLFWLFNIIIVAVLSMPTPQRYFMNEPANTMISLSPYILLPMILVFTAMWGHFLLIKKVLRM